MLKTLAETVVVLGLFMGAIYAADLITETYMTLNGVVRKHCVDYGFSENFNHSRSERFCKPFKEGQFNEK